MVKHIVLFKLKNEIPEAEKHAVALKFKAAIEALPEVISFIKHVEVGININPDEQWDICLDSTFETLDDVRYYSKHPQHVMAAGKLKPHLCGRSCVDFEI